MKKKKSNVTSEVTSSVTKSGKKRKVREGLTRVGVVTAPIKGIETHAKQWNRWTP